METKENGEIERIKKELYTDLACKNLSQNSSSISKEDFKQILEKYFIDVPDEIPEDLSTLELTAKDEYGGYEIKISEIMDAGFKIKKENIYINDEEDEREPVETLCLGYYADIDDDGDVDGIIYADLAYGRQGDGQWDSLTRYDVPIKSNLGQYYIREEKATFDGFGERPIVAPLDVESKEERFFVMALEDLDESLHYWFWNAYGKLKEELNVKASVIEELGKGKEYSEYWKGEYEAGRYGGSFLNGSFTNMWGLEELKTKINEGWFVPSRTEWNTFGGEICENSELNINADNRENFNINLFYWSSTQDDTGDVFMAYFDDGNGGIASATVQDIAFIRLTTSF